MSPPSRGYQVGVQDSSFPISGNTRVPINIRSTQRQGTPFLAYLI